MHCCLGSKRGKRGLSLLGKGGNKRKNMKRVIETSHAVAIAAKLCKPAVIPVYPITPQTHIVERLAEFISNGELNSEMVAAESEHSALSVAIGAEATGV